MIGDDLKSCLHALNSKEYDNLHLLERINLDLQVQNSIVPTAYNLARFKVSGHLPGLHVNISDSKYKSLMRLINVCIPHFDEEGADTFVLPSTSSQPFRLTSGLFGNIEAEYNVEDGDDEQSAAKPDSQQNDQQGSLIEAADSVTDVCVRP